MSKKKKQKGVRCDDKETAGLKTMPASPPPKKLEINGRSKNTKRSRGGGAAGKPDQQRPQQIVSGGGNQQSKKKKNN